jgi:hypothetical protein
VEPSFQVGSDRLRAIVKQDGVLELLTGVEPFQSQVQRIRTVTQLGVLPTDHLGVLAHLKPGFRTSPSPQRLRRLTVGGFSVDLVSPLDE